MTPVKFQFEVTAVAPVRLVRPPNDTARDSLHPLALRSLIAPRLDRQVFPLLDTRARYWRYYLLIGPTPRWSAVKAIAERLLRVVRHNIEGDRARRGFGSRRFNRFRDLGRPPSAGEVRGLVRDFRTQYGRAAANFWNAASNDRGYDALANTASRLRRATSFDGFFESAGDASARRIFHRIIRHQTSAAEEIYRVLKRQEFDAWESVARLSLNSLKSEEAKRLILAWSILRSLYSDARREGAEGEEVAAGSNPGDDAEIVARIARIALRFLAGGVAPELDPMIRLQITRELRSALSQPPYRPPRQTPELPRGQSIQRLFPDLRLSSFAGLLAQTSPSQ